MVYYEVFGIEAGEREAEMLFEFSGLDIESDEYHAAIIKSLEDRGVTDVTIRNVLE